MFSFAEPLLLNSWTFAALAAISIFWSQLVRFVTLRNIGILAANVFFLAFFIHDLGTMLVLVGYLAMIYVLGRWKVHRDGELPPGVFTLVIVALWAFLFLIKGPQLLAPANPFFHYPIQIIGISYITFRGISYVSDIDVIGEKGALPYLGYMLFFPTMIAGPLAKYDDFLKCWYQPAPQTIPVLHHFHRIANGLIQKFAISDNIVSWGAFAVGADYASYDPAIVAASIVVQFFVIFFDFAGYTNMMIGIAGLMGFGLPENFNKPWLARNVQEFWQRWHMSMTRFIQDYIYTPAVRQGMQWFGRSRAWTVAIFINFFCMMLIALWHAPTLGFVCFGLMHGLALTVVQVWRRLRPPNPAALANSALDWAARLFNLLFIAISMVLWNFGPQKALAIVGYAMGIR